MKSQNSLEPNFKKPVKEPFSLKKITVCGGKHSRLIAKRISEKERTVDNFLLC